MMKKHLLFASIAAVQVSSAIAQAISQPTPPVNTASAPAPVAAVPKQMPPMPPFMAAKGAAAAPAVTPTAAPAAGAVKAPTVLTLKRVKQAPVAPAPAVAAKAEADTSTAALRLPLPRPRAQYLPGIGNMPGEKSEMRVVTVRVGSDRNEAVYVALNQLNKISTPFADPQIIDATGATLKAVGQDLFLKPASDAPFTVYVTDGGKGQATGITLVPRANMPAQSIVLELDNPSAAARSVASADADEPVASDYVSRINGIIKSLALGNVPAGFTKGRLPNTVVTGKELVIQPQHKYSGSTYDVYAYKVRSVSTVPLEMKEDAFYSDVVRAVAFYPSAMLQTGEETTVFVVADRPASEAAR